MAMWPGRSVVIMVACHHELPAVGSGLRLIGIGELHPAARRAFFGEPFVLRIRQQFLAVLRRAQNIDAEVLSGGGDERAAMGMFARRRFWHARRQAGIPINVFAGDPFALDAHGIEHLHHGLRLGRDGVGRVRRAGKNDENNEDATYRGSAQ